MQRLGYKHYVSQGGDWGAIVSDVMARQAPAGLLGIHVNMPATVPADVAKALADSANRRRPDSPTAEKAAFDALERILQEGLRLRGDDGHPSRRPWATAWRIRRSGLAAWIYDKFAAWTDSGGKPEQALTQDEMLDDITLYWLTNTGTSSSRLYWESRTAAARSTPSRSRSRSR